MRLLFVIPGISGGGSEHSLRELVPALTDAGIDVSIAYMVRRNADNEDELHRAGARMHRIAETRFDSRVRGVRRVIAQDRPDIVHTTLFDGDLVGRLAAWRPAGSSPVVVSSIVNTSYDPVRLRDPNVRSWKLQAVRLADAWTARHLTDHFHAVSCAVKSATVRALRIDPDRVTVIERGRAPARLGDPSPERRARARAALGLSPDAQLVVTVGRQEFQKAQSDLVRAFDLAATTHAAAELLLVGRTGNLSSDVEASIRRARHRERIHVLGHREDVPEILAAADVFALPSLYEGFPGVVIEAMALGLPVVASRIPPLREVVEEQRSGLLVPPADPVQLAKALSRLLDEPETRRRFGERGRELFLARLTAEQSHRRMIELYRRLVQS